METACYQYSLGTTLDIKRLERIPGMKRPGKLEMLEAEFGAVTVQLFKSGEMRVFSPGQPLDRLQPALLASSIKIMELLTAVKKAGHNIDEQSALSSGHPMQFEYLAPDGVRPSFTGVGVNVLRELAYAPYELSQQFQLERNAVQAGENAGRRLVDATKPKSVTMLNDSLVHFMEQNGIGLATFTEEKEERSTYPAHVLRLEESAFAAGMPMTNKPYCHFVRGLLRGAYVAFYELENIDVKEPHCWGMGNDYCLFRAAVFPK